MKQSGVLGVGGDHITNDISMGLRIPMTRAEKLKIEEGSVTLGNCLPGETVLLKDDSGFRRKGDRARDAQHDHSFAAARNVRAAEAEARGRAVHQLHRRRHFHHRRMQPSEWDRSSGRGNFRIAGARRSRADHVRPDVSAFENPQFSAAIGLIKYAQAVQVDRRPTRGFGRLFGKIFNGMRS